MVSHPLRKAKRFSLHYFKTGPEVVRPAAMLCILFPFSIGNSEELLHARGFDVNHRAVCLWWHRFRPIWASDIRNRRDKSLRLSR